MVSKINTVAFQGIDVVDVDVQVQIAGGLPTFTIVGLPDKAVAESRERVRAALSAIGLALPPERITVNLAPADLPKEGSHFDLPIALGLLAATPRVSSRLRNQSSILRVPLIAGPSSSPVIKRLIEPSKPSPRRARKRDTAATKQAIAPFMSVAPRPYSAPSITSAPNGSRDHAAASPTGTTSVWPAKQKFAPPLPSRAYRLSTSGVPGSENGSRRGSNPRVASAASSTPCAPLSSGVTLGQRISRWASSRSLISVLNRATDR